MKSLSVTYKLIKICFVIAVLSAFFGNAVFASSAADTTETQQKIGITLGLHSDDFSYSYEQMIQEMYELNAEWVCLNIKFFQKNIRSSKIDIPKTDSDRWQQIENTVCFAKSLGLKVNLLPTVLLEEAAEDEWRGKIKPKNLTAWFNSYRKLMLQISDMAERHEVDMLTAGSEFNSLQKYRDQWVSTIDMIRLVFSGTVSYSVNWDAIDLLTFGDQVDMLGISGYFSLTNKMDPSVDELYAEWVEIRETIRQLHLKLKKPIYFSEIGYASQDGINTNPWNYMITKIVDLQEQRDCYEAFTKAWIDVDWLAGIFFYEWYGKGGDCDIGYTPKDKPALEILQQWFDK